MLASLKSAVFFLWGWWICTSKLLGIPAVLGICSSLCVDQHWAHYEAATLVCVETLRAKYFRAVSRDLDSNTVYWYIVSGRLYNITPSRNTCLTYCMCMPSLLNLFQALQFSVCTTVHLFWALQWCHCLKIVAVSEIETTSWVLPSNISPIKPHFIFEGSCRISLKK